jgi:aerobic C4-dicarboxylate transport protein
MQATARLRSKQLPWFVSLWFLVVVFMLAGCLFGILNPHLAVRAKPVVDNFIYVIKLLVGPIVFCSVVSGILGMGSLKQLGSIGLKTLVYFEIIATIALIIGLTIGHLFHAGTGLNLSINSIDPSLVSQYTQHTAQATHFTAILNSALPPNPWQPFIKGNTLQILTLALMCGFVLFYGAGRYLAPINLGLHRVQAWLFTILSWVMWFSPFAAFAAMSFMLGSFGLAVLWHMLGLVATMIFACGFFLLVVLGSLARLVGFSMFSFIKLIKDEIILVFATSSSESALGPIMHKLKQIGASESVVGIVIPAGYSFNLDGTNIYLALVIAFLCQAFNIHLTWQEHLTIILVLMLTSKGAAGVTGSGFIVLAGTLAALHGKIPVVTIAILLGIDKIMSELRATTNLVGNSFATILVAWWDKKLDWDKFKAALANK